ncbi:uncharacterized protein [Macrobrachium rosenbergii]|uniref:uncharacterized protein n=1 Tax=Macrobrachium rosenbergii TaxID=79674 RepID=UPI0034D7203D
MVSAPLVEVELSFPGYNRKTELAVVDSLPIPGIDGILGNDMLDDKGRELFPILSLNTCPVAVTTRAAAKAADLLHDDDYDDLHLSSLAVEVERPGSVVGSSDKIFGKVLKPDWDRPRFIEAQKEEFNFELGDTSDLTKPRFCVVKNVLYRVSRPSSHDLSVTSRNEQIVVPTQFRDSVLKLAHEDSFSGHFGVWKTFSRLAKYFWWPGLKSSVKHFVSSCEVCQVMGKPNQTIPKAPLNPIPAIGEPFVELVIDVVGPLPRTKSGFTHLLTVMDRASRYPDAFPMKRITSRAVFEKLIEFFLSIWCCSFELVFGHKVRGPLEIVHEMIESGQRGEINVGEFVETLKSKLSTAWKFARENLASSQAVMKLNYDKKTKVSSDALFDNVQNLEILKGGLEHLETYQRNDILELIFAFPELFQNAPGRTSLLQHDVDVGSASPVKQSPYRLNPIKRDIVEKEIKYMLEHDLIQPSVSPWSSPIVLVKKSDGKFRMCVDYRKVNTSTKNDSFPLPRIDDCLDQIGSSKFITKLDLLKGYWQVPLSTRAREISAFVTPFGLYECKVMPFGMKNAACTFQRLMNRVICGLEGVEIYIDDLVVYSNDWRTHMIRLRKVFEALRAAGLVVNLGKCEFGKARVCYLGHEVGLGLVAPKQANIEAIINLKRPCNVREVRRF